jgi:hypothetical protein
MRMPGLVTSFRLFVLKAIRWGAAELSLSALHVATVAPAERYRTVAAVTRRLPTGLGRDRRLPRCGLCLRAARVAHDEDCIRDGTERFLNDGSLEYERRMFVDVIHGRVRVLNKACVRWRGVLGANTPKRPDACSETRFDSITSIETDVTVAFQFESFVPDA